MNARTSVAVVLALVFGLAWLSAVVSGSSEWGIGAFALMAILLFLANRSQPAVRRTRLDTAGVQHDLSASVSAKQ